MKYGVIYNPKIGMTVDKDALFNDIVSAKLMRRIFMEHMGFPANDLRVCVVNADARITSIM